MLADLVASSALPAAHLRPGYTVAARRTRRLCAIALALIPGLLPAAEQSRYQLVDSGFPADDWRQPYWLDNERVIFKGFEVGSYSKQMHEASRLERRAKGYDEHGMHTGYYIWDTKKNEVTLYKDKITNLCVEDGIVVYETDDGNKTTVLMGALSEESPIDISPEQLNNGLSANCWVRRPKRTEAQQGRHILYLRPGWGYLDIGPTDPPRDPKAPVLYYKEGVSKPIELPIPAGRLMNAGYVRFVPHENRHLIAEGNVSRRREAWFMTSDGKVSEVILPSGPWLSERLYRVKGGIFLSSAYTQGKRSNVPPGAYLVPDGQWWQLLFIGRQGKAAVSPDGCKVAMTITPDEMTYYGTFREWIAGRPGQKTMRVVNVCQGEGK